MRGLSKNKKDELFEGTGPLSTFSAKIKLAYALRLLDDKSVLTADCIRNIRNAFAHADERVSFDDEKIANLAKNLPDAKKHKHLKDTYVPAVQNVARSINVALHELTKKNPED
jgi:DNA-binding MltR family transcriptional regulator